MKHAIIIIAMAAGLAYGQESTINRLWTVGGTNSMPIISMPNAVNTVVVTDKIISHLIANGDVCRARGKHEWRYLTPIIYEWTSHKDWSGDTGGSRKCDLCGRKETKQEVWKEDGK